MSIRQIDGMIDEIISYSVRSGLWYSKSPSKGVGYFDNRLIATVIL